MLYNIYSYYCINKLTYNIMKTISAKDLKVGDQYQSTKSIQEVTRIVKVSDKAIEYRTKRISPEPYDGDFFQRKRLSTQLTKVN